MAGLLAVFAAFEREILQERVQAGLAHARQNGKRLGRPQTAALQAGPVRELYHAREELTRAGLSGATIASKWLALIASSSGRSRNSAWHDV